MGTKSDIEKYIKSWEQRCYKSGIPDEAPIELEHLTPSFKKICKALLKNDITLELLGFQKPKSKAYNELKKKELIERGVIKRSNQLKLAL